MKTILDREEVEAIVKTHVETRMFRQEALDGKVVTVKGSYGSSDYEVTITDPEPEPKEDESVLNIEKAADIAYGHMDLDKEEAAA